MGRKKRPLEPYRGKLSAQEIADGMNVAIRNAQRLLEDAKLLLKEKRFPTAASVAALAIEESGKVSILRGMAMAPNVEIFQDGWKDYRSHTSKNVAWIIVELAAKGARNLYDLAPIYDSNSDHPEVLDTIKQLGFYTDRFGSRVWSEPSKVIDADLAKMLVMVAGVLCGKRHETTAREIELWVEHVGPYWGTRHMARGVVEFYEAMKREGLPGDAEEMRKFLFGDPKLSK